MLRDADPVEPQALGELNPLDHAAIGSHSGVAVIGVGRSPAIRRAICAATGNGRSQKTSFHDFAAADLNFRKGKSSFVANSRNLQAPSLGDLRAMDPQGFAGLRVNILETEPACSSNVADARQYLFGKEFERSHQAPSIGGAGVLKGEIEHSNADLLAAALDLFDDRVGAAVERGRQHPPTGGVRGSPATLRWSSFKSALRAPARIGKGAGSLRCFSKSSWASSSVSARRILAR